MKIDADTQVDFALTLWGRPKYSAACVRFCWAPALDFGPFRSFADGFRYAFA